MPNIVFDLILQYRYFLIIPVTIVEGPLIMLMCGFLLRLDAFALVPVYISLVIGDFLGDIIWYAIGYFWGPKFIKKFGKYVSLTEESVDTVKHIFHKYHSSILIVSKVTMGFGFALVTLFTAGLIKIPFGKYLLLNTIGGFIWTGLLLFVGYYLGEFYLKANRGLEWLVMTAGVAIIIALGYGFGKYVKNRFKNK